MNRLLLVMFAFFALVMFSACPDKTPEVKDEPAAEKAVEKPAAPAEKADAGKADAAVGKPGKAADKGKAKADKPK